MKEEILSVGIDIGTSTTQLIFSKITLLNTASSFSIPRISITNKEIVYKSKIYFTPLINNGEIDIDEVLKIVDREYKNSKVNKEDIKVGAVIITGETARLQNAKTVLHKLSGFAGDFVVATAGPDLESIISGKGAGADVFSKTNNTKVLNMDIGGGTSNLALFNRGELIETGCFNVGGRLIKLDKDTKEVIYISEKIKDILKHENININIHEKPSISELKKIVDILVRTLEMAAGLRKKDDIYKTLITNKGLMDDKIECVSFSGGVADYIYKEDEEIGEDIFKFSDIGILLGKAIRESLYFKKIKILKSNQTIRATVVGAGSHTTEISGSTITYTRNKFPIKNLPILKLNSSDENDLKTLGEKITSKLKWFEVSGEFQKCAIALKGKKNPTFKEITELAQAIILGSSEILKNNYPIIVICENDIAKVLGQTIYRLLNYKEDVLCIDGIKVFNGDYVDIGKPVVDGKVVPVVIKTLVFK